MSTQQQILSPNNDTLQHAVVVGASMAGLLAARTLSDYFKQVTVIERDQLPDEVSWRKGVPQGYHAHVLLLKGEMILKELFPDLYDLFSQAGAVSLTSNETQWLSCGRWKVAPREPIHTYTSSRPLLEQCVRQLLSARGNVRFIARCETKKLLASEDHQRITGVSLVYPDEGEREEELAADLVVDASGRGSQSSRWLTSLGYDDVSVEKVKVDIGYATRIYRRPTSRTFPWRLLIVYPTPPQEQRYGLIFPIENDQWMVTLVGRLRDYPPDDEAGFLEYIRSLPSPDLYEAIKDAEPLTPIHSHRFPANQWRHYEKLARFPEGLIVLGDALCSFNPLYGQGMSIAALGARRLDTSIRERLHRNNNLDGLARRFQPAVAREVGVAWMMATGEDFRYAATIGKRPFGSRLLLWYSYRVNELTGSNVWIAERFYDVMNLLRSPATLFHPRVVWAVLAEHPPRHSPRLSENKLPLSAAADPQSQVISREPV